MTSKQKKALKELFVAIPVSAIALASVVPACIYVIKYCVWMWTMIMN